MAKPARGTPATVVLTREKVPFTTHPYDVDPKTPAYGEAVAAALRIDPPRVFKTLVATVDGQLGVGIVPVARSLDLKALAATLGAKRAMMAEPAAAERATGYVTGGISPLGQRSRLPVVLDDSALAFETIFVSAGKRGLQLELSPADLVHLTDAAVAPIATS
ncbi:Cys-tRNA(Pro) deacylase [Asanoa sp. NPDC049573]|uniref:Cys-tRNA(Pro) deacylase n=1 Tax=Asanoa sp. NPDC049573 TaxID=3155396 RepID=UPI003438E8C3